MRTLLLSMFLISSIVGCGGGGSSSSPPLSVQDCVVDQADKNKHFKLADGDIILVNACIDTRDLNDDKPHIKTRQGQTITIDFPKSYSEKLALELAKSTLDAGSSESPEKLAKTWLENGELAMRVNVRRPFYDVSISSYTRTWTNTVKGDFADIEFKAPSIYGYLAFVLLEFKVELYNTVTGEKFINPPSLIDEIWLTVWSE